MKIIKILFLALITITIYSSCDKIEGPYLEPQNIAVGCDTPQFASLTNPYQKIFLEEFTGHTCVNCPQGHKVAKDLKNKYGDTLLIMSIHAGIFSTPEPPSFTADYRTEAGNEMNSVFGIVGYPCGLVNRTEFGGSQIIDKSGWATAIEIYDRTSPKIALQIENYYNTTNQKLCTFIKTTFLQNSTKNLNLTVFLIEDSIVSPQKNNDPSLGSTPTIVDYVHSHLLRGSINSVWGDAISTTSQPEMANNSKIKGYSFSFSGKSFKPEKCSIIAVVYDKDDIHKKIIQVEEKKLF